LIDGAATNENSFILILSRSSSPVNGSKLPLLLPLLLSSDGGEPDGVGVNADVDVDDDDDALAVADEESPGVSPARLGSESMNSVFARADGSLARGVLLVRLALGVRIEREYCSSTAIVRRFIQLVMLDPELLETDCDMVARRSNGDDADDAAAAADESDSLELSRLALSAGDDIGSIVALRSKRMAFLA
jgi:hypothetical protein